MKKEKYFGITLNDEIPKIDKVNKYIKQVKFQFEGQVYIVERKEKDIIKTEIQNEYIFKKEGKYEIEFTNYQKETFLFQIRIKKSYSLIIIFLFLILFLIGLLGIRQFIDKNFLVNQICNYINLSIIGLEVSHDSENQYDFEVTFENTFSENINIIDTISSKAMVKNKIAPGISGNFSIIMSTKRSDVDMDYMIFFKDLNNEKPKNMIFKIRGDDRKYLSLQELEKSLKGRINKHSRKKIIIEWEWCYETGKSQKEIMENDKFDTENGKKLKKYQFNINVIGEEVS